MKDRIDHFQTQEWQDYIDSHPYLILVHQNLSELTSSQFWGLTSDQSDLVSKLNLQLDLMGILVRNLLSHGCVLIIVLTLQT